MSKPVVLITGASGGIGLATAKKMLARGYRLALTTRSETKQKQLENEFINETIDVKVYRVDVTDESTHKPFFMQVQKQFGRLDALIHCAGNLYQTPLMMVKSEAIDQQLNIHLKTSILLAQFSSRLMARNNQDNRQLAITFISSVVAQQGAAGQSVYSAAKSGLTGFVKSLAKELGTQGIRVNGVSPGFIETDLVADFTEEQRAALTSQTALKRLGEPEQVAEAIAFICSDQASYITGQLLAVDAGLTLH